jgi:hypothetical protein
MPKTGRECSGCPASITWPWVRNPLPPRSEGSSFRLLRQRLALDDATNVAPGDAIAHMNSPTRTLLGQVAHDFGRNHNPFIRHIVRRTRQYLEDTIDPTTGDPYLKPVGIYAGGANSGILLAGQFKACHRDDIKAKVKHGEIRLLIGTDAASEGLNLQRLGTLINLDLPWNPTRLEQRKGRI